MTETITLGGKRRDVTFTLGAFRLARLKHGATVTLADIESLDIETVPRLLWIGLLAEEPDLTEEACVLMLAQDPDAEEAALDVLARGMGRVISLLSRFGNASTEASAGKPLPAAQTEGG